MRYAFSLNAIEEIARKCEVRADDMETAVELALAADVQDETDGEVIDANLFRELTELLKVREEDGKWREPTEAERTEYYTALAKLTKPEQPEPKQRVLINVEGGRVHVAHDPNVEYKVIFGDGVVPRSDIPEGWGDLASQLGVVNQDLEEDDG